MEKRGILLILVFIILNLFLVFAQENESENAADILVDKIDVAYQCLEDQIEKKSEGSLSLSESIFSTLALGPREDLEEVIEANKRSGEDCWPKNGCKIKETAQVLLAYDRIGRNSDSIEEWLKSKEKNAKELTWYIEIDIQNHAASECTLKYDDLERNINVKEDMTLEGNGGRCLSIGYGGYWLKINENCLDNEFEISCDQDFITTLAYQRGTSGTVFVSSETHSSSSLGTTSESVKSKCFSASTGAGCDYEGTLWASIALDKTESDVSAHVPYLLALVDNNQQYFPSSFLYVLTGGEDQYYEVVQKQKTGGYWDIAGAENRFYDTSLAMFALSGTGAGEVESARSYLLEVQTKEGCWNNNNIRDTAFILYSGWGRAVGRVPGTVNGDSGLVSCVDAGFYCENRFRCTEFDGEPLYNYDCSEFGAGLECCSIEVRELSCSEKGGVSCSASQECSGRVESSLDGSCCIGICEAIEMENICVLRGGDCKIGCGDDEERIDDGCGDSDRVCCVATFSDEDEKGGISTIWIWILVILIILVVLGIIFRKKIRIWWWKRRGKAKIKGVPKRPGVPPGGVMARYAPRYGSPAVRRSAPSSRRASPQDKEMEETMKKLREMSK